MKAMLHLVWQTRKAAVIAAGIVFASVFAWFAVSDPFGFGRPQPVPGEVDTVVLLFDQEGSITEVVKGYDLEVFFETGYKFQAGDGGIEAGLYHDQVTGLVLGPGLDLGLFLHINLWPSQIVALAKPNTPILNLLRLTETENAMMYTSADAIDTRLMLHLPASGLASMEGPVAEMPLILEHALRDSQPSPVVIRSGTVTKLYQTNGLAIALNSAFTNSDFASSRQQAHLKGQVPADHAWFSFTSPKTADADFTRVLTSLALLLTISLLVFSPKLPVTGSLRLAGYVPQRLWLAASLLWPALLVGFFLLARLAAGVLRLNQLHATVHGNVWLYGLQSLFRFVPSRVGLIGPMMDGLYCVMLGLAAGLPSAIAAALSGGRRRLVWLALLPLFGTMTALLANWGRLRYIFGLRANAFAWMHTGLPWLIIILSSLLLALFYKRPPDSWRRQKAE
jgi:hypothetical protein